MKAEYRYPLMLWFLIALVSYAYLAIAIPSCVQYVDACLGGSEAALLAPFRYRVLQPLIEGMFSGNVLLTDVFLQAGLTAGTLTGLYIWLKRIANPARAMGGVLLFALVWIVSFSYYFRSLGTSIELCLLVWFLVLIEKRLIWLVCMVILASLNRETALILPVSLMAWNWTEHGSKRYGALTLVFVAITAALHIALGSADHMLGLQGTFEYNLQYLDSGLLALFLLFPLVSIVILQYRASRPIYRRLAWVAGGYLIAALVGGAWSEALRLCLPALVMVMPIMIGGE